MKTNYQIFVLALMVLFVSWSSWILFSDGLFGLGYSRETLDLLGDIFNLVHEPGPLGNNSDRPPRFSLVAMPSMQKIPLPVNTGAMQLNSDLEETAAQPSLAMFSQTYVISLPSRVDRRGDMERVHQVVAPRLTWTYFNATPADDPRVAQILEHVRQIRNQDGPGSRLGTATFTWPSDLSSLEAGQAGADLWTAPALDSADRQRAPPITTLLSAEAAAASLDRDQPPSPPSLQPLTCASRDFARGPPYSPALPPYMVLTASKVACWHSHVQVLRQIADAEGLREGGGAARVASTASGIGRGQDREAVLVLEDDVDVERDLAARLRALWPALPAQWDMLFLGKCYRVL